MQTEFPDIFFWRFKGQFIACFNCSYSVQDGFGSITSELSGRRAADLESGGLFNRPYFSNWQRTSSFDYTLGKDDTGINYYREPPDRRDISAITLGIAFQNRHTFLSNRDH